MLPQAPDPAQDGGHALEVVTAVVRLLRHAAAGSPWGSQGVSLTEFRILKRLARRVLMASDLAAELDVTTATISAAVDALVRRGLVARDEPGADRRAVPLRITEAGTTMLQAAFDRQQSALVAITERLRPGERRALSVAVNGLVRALALDASALPTRR